MVCIKLFGIFKLLPVTYFLQYNKYFYLDNRNNQWNSSTIGKKISIIQHSTCTTYYCHCKSEGKYFSNTYWKLIFIFHSLLQPLCTCSLNSKLNSMKFKVYIHECTCTNKTSYMYFSQVSKINKQDHVYRYILLPIFSKIWF